MPQSPGKLPQIGDGVERSCRIGSLDVGVKLRGIMSGVLIALTAGLVAGCGGDDGSTEQSTTAGGSDEVDAATAPVELGSKPRVAPNGYATVPGSALVGTWEGVATQIGPGEDTRTYPVSMQINPKAQVDKDADGYVTVSNGAVRYESFGCSGAVQIVAAGKGDKGITNEFGATFHAPASDVGYRYTLNETIQSRRDQCGAGGRITAVTEGDELDWRWKYRDVEATAILHRTDAPAGEVVSEDVIREVQGHEYSGAVTQWGPRGQRSRYELYYVLYPPGKPAPGPGDGHTQSYDGPCMGNAVLRIQSVSGDRAVLRRRFDRYSNCIGGGVIQTRAVGDKLLFRWLRQRDDDRGEESDVIALGTLSKSGPAQGPAPG
jgi:hypothetical protein